jgi:hypothetical protein
MSDALAVPRPLAPAEKSIILRYFAGSGTPGVDVLNAQIPYVTVVGGDTPTIDLAVDAENAEPAHVAVRGPLQPRMFAIGPDGEIWGEIMVWVTDGYLSGLGLAWWNDDLPRSWESVGATAYEWEVPPGH